MNKGANQSLALSNLASRVAAPGPRAVIIKGNPYFIAKDPDGYDAFYKEIKDILAHKVIKDILGIPESKRIVIAIAIGYPDWDFPANKIESKREPLQNVTTWYGFD